MGLLDSIVNFFTPSSSAPAVPLPDGTKTGQLPAANTQSVSQATSATQTKSTAQAKKASTGKKAKQATKAQPETEALLNNKDTDSTAQSQTKPGVQAQPKATEKTIEAALRDYEDTFGVYNPDGSLNVQATIDEFNVQQVMGLLKEKPRDMTDFSDKRNWDDALKMLADWAPQGPSILFRGQGGNKVYRRN